MEIIPDGKAAGKQLPEQDAADGGTAGIAEPARDKNACQKINRQDTDGLLQHLRKGRDECFLYAEEEAAKAGACCHKRHSQCQKAQGKSGAPIPKHRKGDAIRAEKQDTADSHTCTEGKADRLLDNTPDIPILSADVFLRGKVGNGCGEAGRGDAPCKHIQRQNQLIQPHALCADGV